MARYWTADPHYWHKNIIKYCNRPYANREEMNEDLKKKHNEVVGVDDEIVFVGDIGFCSKIKMREILGDLNGIKTLVRGNHDEFTAKEYLEIGFTQVVPIMSVYFEGVGPVGVAHDPSNCIMDMSMPWLNGHLHQSYKQFGNSINVGVDVWDFYPVSEEVLAPMLANIYKYGWEAMKNDPTGNIKSKGLVF